MPTTTTVDTFKRGLLAALQARSGLSGVKVAYSWPGPSATPEMIAFTGSTAQAEPAAVKAGRMARQETYTVETVIWVIKPGTIPEASADVEQRAFELLAEVDSALADAPRLVPQIQWANVSAHRSAFEPFDKGWAWLLTVTITVHARLT